MKILHVVPSYIPAYRYGGPIKMVHELCASLVRQGADVSVFTTNIDQDRDLDVPLNKPVNMDGVKVHYYPVTFPRFYCYSGQLGSAVKERIPEFDIVHIHSVYLYPTAITCRWCLRYKKPYILNPFGALDPSMIKLRSGFKKLLYIRLVENRAINGAKAVHTASQYEKNNYEKLGFETPAVVIPRGIDLSEYSNRAKYNSLINKYPELSGKKIILFLGRIHPKKGLELLFDAFKKIADEKDDVFLVIAGTGDKRFVSKIKGLFRKNGLADRVKFTGMLLDADKLSAFYASDLFVLPSYGENFGIAVLEAMACAIPVVVTNRVGISPEIKEFNAGIITDYDSKQTADAVLNLLNNDALRKKMGENARRLVEKKFTLDEAGNMIEVYKRLMV